MSDVSGGPGWWQASDGKWYPPESVSALALPPPPPPVPGWRPEASDASGLRPDVRTLSADEKRRFVKRPWFWVATTAALLAIIAIVIVAAGGGGGGGASSSTKTISGQLVLFEATTSNSVDGSGGFNEGMTCYGAPGYASITEGAEVDVKNASGTLIASGSLSRGVAHNGACDFTFSVVVPIVSFYQVGMPNRGQLTYSQSEMTASGWRVKLSL